MINRGFKHKSVVLKDIFLDKELEFESIGAVGRFLNIHRTVVTGWLNGSSFNYPLGGRYTARYKSIPTFKEVKLASNGLCIIVLDFRTWKLKKYTNYSIFEEDYGISKHRIKKFMRSDCPKVEIVQGKYIILEVLIEDDSLNPKNSLILPNNIISRKMYHYGKEDWINTYPELLGEEFQVKGFEFRRYAYWQI